MRDRPAGSRDPVFAPGPFSSFHEIVVAGFTRQLAQAYLDGEPLVPVPFDPSVEHDRPLQLRDQRRKPVMTLTDASTHGDRRTGADAEVDLTHMDAMIEQQEAVLLARTASLAGAARPRPRRPSPAGSRRPGRTLLPRPCGSATAPARGSGTSTGSSTPTSTVDSASGWRARAPGHRRGRHPPRDAGHALRAADRGRHPGVAPAREPVRTPVVALQQLRHRVDDGRVPPHAHRDRPRQGHQGRGQLPRAPRRSSGVGLPRRSPGWSLRAPEQRALLQRHP